MVRLIKSNTCFFATSAAGTCENVVTTSETTLLGWERCAFSTVIVKTRPKLCIGIVWKIEIRLPNRRRIFNLLLLTLVRLSPVAIMPRDNVRDNASSQAQKLIKPHLVTTSVTMRSKYRHGLEILLTNHKLCTTIAADLGQTNPHQLLSEFLAARC